MTETELILAEASAQVDRELSYVYMKDETDPGEPSMLEVAQALREFRDAIRAVDIVEMEGN